MKSERFIQRHAVAAYFVSTFLISWLGAFILVGPLLYRKQPIPTLYGILMFPIMLLGPLLAGLVFTRVLDGRTGLRDLASRLFKGKIAAKWYLISLFVLPAAILVVLLFLREFVSGSFTPNFFPFGFVFGIPAGFIEEIGWTGYAFPRMRLEMGFKKASIALGFLWGLWHLPVIDFLGGASPHGHYLFAFGAAFIIAMAAVRVLICLVYSHTNSILIAQIMHAVSTNSLVVFGPKSVTPAQEALWYAVYAVVLWVMVLILLKIKKAANPGRGL